MATQTPNKFARTDKPVENVPLHVETALFPAPAGSVVVTLKNVTVRFIGENGVLEARFDRMPLSHPQLYEQLVDGKVRRSNIYRVRSIMSSGTELTDFGVNAVAFSPDAVSLVLLREAVNEVEGQQLKSRPVSEVQYRRFGNRKSIKLTEVQIV